MTFIEQKTEQLQHFLTKHGTKKSYGALEFWYHGELLLSFLMDRVFFNGMNLGSSKFCAQNENLALGEGMPAAVNRTFVSSGMSRFGKR